MVNETVRFMQDKYPKDKKKVKIGWQRYFQMFLNINILVSACRYIVKDYKKDIEMFLKDGLKDSEVAILRNLESKIRSVNFDHSEGILFPIKI